MINALASLFDRMTNFVNALTAHTQRHRLKEFTRSNDCTKMLFDIDDNHQKESPGSMNLIEPGDSEDGSIK
jgi:hypothetical protein